MLEHLHKHPDSVPLLLDFEKAYDRVSHLWLKEVLHTTGFPPLITTLILEINSGHTRLLINNQLSCRIPILSGVKQGDPLSPTLFILGMQPFLTELQQHGISSQAYADDTLISLHQSSDMQTLANITNRYTEASGQQLNTDKCTLLIREDDERFPQHPYTEAAE